LVAGLAGVVLTAALPTVSITLHVSDADSAVAIPNAKARIGFTVSDGHGGTPTFNGAV
jgi:hypothetical protein